MDKPESGLGLGIGVGVASTLLLIAVIGLIVVYAGAYNVAATEEHSSLGRWAFDTTFHRSVKARAADMEPPAELATLVERGATEYKEMCQHCHGGAGVERDEWASGMRPQPPHLTEEASEWEPKEVFWLVKHGAKMTGMPAFGPTHDDETLWGIVAFVKALPAMTPERYSSLGERQTMDESHEHGH